MDHIGIDVHKKESQIYALAEGSAVIERRIRTEATRMPSSAGRPVRRPHPHDVSPQTRTLQPRWSRRHSAWIVARWA